MANRFTKKHDADGYWIYDTKDHKFHCICGRTIRITDACRCEVCQKVFCSHCGCDDYKNINWFVCQDCLDNPDRIIDAILSTFR